MSYKSRYGSLARREIPFAIMREGSNSASPRPVQWSPTELSIFDEAERLRDPLMTREVGMLIKQLHHDNGVTILCVTHDIASPDY